MDTSAFPINRLAWQIPSKPLAIKPNTISSEFVFSTNEIDQMIETPLNVIKSLVDCRMM
jgi:hypothetical protein